MTQIPIRAINVIVTLGTGSFGESGQNTVTLSGFRTSADIVKDGVPAMNTATIRVYGISRSIANQVTQIGLLPDYVRRNLVTVLAGDDQVGMSLAFCGGIEAAWEDLSNPPETSLIIIAKTGLIGQMKPVSPGSFTGPTDVAVIVKQLAPQMGYTYEDNNVHKFIDSPYLPGTARQQILAAAAAADVYVVFDDDGDSQRLGTVTLVPINGARGTPVPLISPPPTGGLVSYPTYVGPGLIGLRMLYNPQIRFLGNLQVQGSSIIKANGLWTAVHVAHELDAQLPNGRWYTEVTANMFLPGIQR